MKDAFGVYDLVVGETGYLQVGQLVQPGAAKLIAIGLEPQQVSETIEW